MRHDETNLNDFIFFPRTQPHCSAINQPSAGAQDWWRGGCHGKGLDARVDSRPLLVIKFSRFIHRYPIKILRLFLI